jgi:uncharacterized iron-regulated membrane protein
MTPLHYGTFGGTFTRVLYILLGFVPLVLFVTGLAMWWNRVLAKLRPRDASVAMIPVGLATSPGRQIARDKRARS